MKILFWLEDQLDKVSPRAAATGRSVTKFNSETFVSLMDRILDEKPLSLRSSTSSTYILNFSGRFIGDLSQAKILLGKKTTPNMYENMKSRYKCVLNDDGTIEVTSFDHIVGLKKERIAFEEVLTRRLAFLLNLINGNEST